MIGRSYYIYILLLWVALCWSVRTTAQSNISGVVNQYVPAISYDSCGVIQVLNSSGFQAGDRVLVIQMQGAILDYSNSPAYGDIVGRNGAGNYEFNELTYVAGNYLGLTHFLDNYYDFVTGKVQVIKVPQYANATVNATLTCQPWNGLTGGVLVLEASGILDLQADIDVSTTGFPGGTVYSQLCAYGNSSFFYSQGQQGGARKGMGLAAIQIGSIHEYGKGANANGGGGGNGHNRGGGGGANGGDGGLGGSKVADNSNGEGVGGKAIAYLTYGNIACLGGGGGAGDANQADGTDGGVGAGIVILKLGAIEGNGNQIIANGENISLTSTLDAAGGGGSGGTVLIETSAWGSSTLDIELNGGRGGDNALVSNNNNNAGTGGGGSGGFLTYSIGLTPNVTSSMIGGDAGLITYAGSNLYGTSYGALPGMLGTFTNGLALKESVAPVVLLQPNLGNDTALCPGQSYTVSAGVAGANYYWSTGDTTQSITVTAPDTIWVFADIFGCGTYDTLVLSSLQGPIISLGPDTTLCLGATLVLNAPAGMSSYFWNTGDTTQQLVVTSAGIYSLMVDLNGCIAMDTIDVTYVASNAVNLGPDTTLCSGASLDLIGPPGMNAYIWSTGDTTSVLTVNSAGLYWLQTNVNGCLITDSIDVNIGTIGTLDIGPDTTLCSGSTLTLSGPPGMTSYLWSTGDTLSQINVSAAGSYSLEVGMNTCTASDSLFVTVLANTVDLGPDTLLCPGESLMLLAGAISDPVWSDGSFAISYLINGPGTYWVQSNSVCPASDTITVDYVNLSVPNLGNDTLLCSGDTLTLFSNAPAGTFTWSSGSSADSLLVDVSGVYSISSTQNGCVVFDSVNVQFETFVSGSSYAEMELPCNGQGLMLSATVMGASYQWNTNSTDASISVLSDGLYIVSTNDVCLSHLDTVVVSVTDCDFYVYVPNAFTPNGDGVNDVFLISLAGGISGVEFYIYNRWGELLYATYNTEAFWDGTYKGKLVQDGVYVYHLIYKGIDADGISINKIEGHVTVIK